MQLLAAAPFRSGSAWLGRSQKDGLPSCREVTAALAGSRPSTRAKGAALVAAPLLTAAVCTLRREAIANSRRRRNAPLPCSRACSLCRYVGPRRRASRQRFGRHRAVLQDPYVTPNKLGQHSRFIWQTTRLEWRVAQAKNCALLRTGRYPSRTHATLAGTRTCGWSCSTHEISMTGSWPEAASRA